jgi:hypothetical protein
VSDVFEWVGPFMPNLHSGLYQYAITDIKKERCCPSSVTAVVENFDNFSHFLVVFVIRVVVEIGSSAVVPRL